MIVFLLVLFLALNSGRTFAPQTQIHNACRKISPVFGIPINVATTSQFPDNASTQSDQLSQFDKTIQERYACTRYRTTSEEERIQNINSARELLDIARRAPTGFNAQPYRAILVSNPEAKEKLSRYCLGRNADRVKESDCTAVFLADRECGRDLGRFGQAIRNRDARLLETLPGRKPMTNFVVRKIQVLVLLFSSGYPIPRVLASPISFFVRMGVAAVSGITRRRVLVPSLSSAETWATKNTMLFAMSYMLGCTSRNLATCPMEGYNAGGIRKALGIPRRYAIPLIVSTGKPYMQKSDISDDVGMSHGPGGVATDRFPANEALFMDFFGKNWD